MQITIKSHVLLPLQADETPGMPTYHVVGKIDGNDFSVDASIEIDGRDTDFENASGAADEDNAVVCSEIFDALCEVESWQELHNQQSEEYFSGF